jgi:hypothetical protein
MEAKEKRKKLEKGKPNGLGRFPSVSAKVC